MKNLKNLSSLFGKVDETTLDDVEREKEAKFSLIVVYTKT